MEDFPRSNNETGNRLLTTLEENPAVRGRYLPRHRARVIEQDNLIVVEFVDRPWYTNARKSSRLGRYAAPAAAATAVVGTAGVAAAEGMLLPLWQVALLWGVSLSALTVGVASFF